MFMVVAINMDAVYITGTKKIKELTQLAAITAKSVIYMCIL